MRTSFIYTLSDPTTTEVKYVGQTTTPKLRWYHHKNGQNSNKLKFEWTKNLKKRNKHPIFDIIDEVGEEESDFWERHYISLFKSWGFKLLNVSLGGKFTSWKSEAKTNCSARITEAEINTLKEVCIKNNEIFKRWFLLKLRKENNISSALLFEKTGIHPSMVCRLETKPNYNSCLSSIQKIATFFKIDIRNFFYSKKNPDFWYDYDTP